VSAAAQCPTTQKNRKSRENVAATEGTPDGNMGNFVEELSAVNRLAGLLGLDVISPCNPNPPGVETGADVQFLLGGRKIGVQVTVFHADEAASPARGGSVSRREEQAKAGEAMKSNGVKSYGHSASAKYGPALLRRVEAKVCKALSHGANYNELWLLIAAQIPNWGATASTMISPDVVRVEDLDQLLNEVLAKSLFSRAFLLLHLEGVVYEWQRGKSWRVAREVSPEARSAQKQMQDIAFGRGDVRERWLSDREGMEVAAIMEVLDEFKKAT
jgi:hypothetical protein